MSRFNQICIIGLGYIGLPSAAVFADNGIDVLGVDVNPAAVDSINQGKPHIVEPELDVLLRKVVQNGKLRASLVTEPADAFILAVPTPFKDGHQPDLSFVEAAARSIAPVLKRGDLVILESTSPVGATEQLSAWLAEHRSDLTFPHDAGELSDIRVAHCPERVLPGQILREVVENDRIIGGGQNTDWNGSSGQTAVGHGIAGKILFFIGPVGVLTDQPLGQATHVPPQYVVIEPMDIREQLAFALQGCAPFFHEIPVVERQPGLQLTQYRRGIDRRTDGEGGLYRQ